MYAVPFFGDGLLANRGREAKLALCRRRLGVAVVVGVVALSSAPAPRGCVVCGAGWMIVVQGLPRGGSACGVGSCREDSS